MAGKIKVKCKETGESINKTDAFSIILKGNKRLSYFKSEKEFNIYEKKLKIKEEEKDLWNKCNDLVVNSIPKTKEEKYPPYLFKKINDVRKESSTSFLYYLLNNIKFKESFISFKLHNPKSSLSHKVNTFVFLINKYKENLFIKYTETLMNKEEGTNSSDFVRKSSNKSKSMSFLKYLEDD